MLDTLLHVYMLHTVWGNVPANTAICITKLPNYTGDRTILFQADYSHKQDFCFVFAI